MIAPLSHLGSVEMYVPCWCPGVSRTASCPPKWSSLQYVHRISPLQMHSVREQQLSTLVHEARTHTRIVIQKQLYRNSPMLRFYYLESKKKQSW